MQLKITWSHNKLKHNANYSKDLKNKTDSINTKNSKFSGSKFTEGCGLSGGNIGE